MIYNRNQSEHFGYKPSIRNMARCLSYCRTIPFFRKQMREKLPKTHKISIKIVTNGNQKVVLPLFLA